MTPAEVIANERQRLNGHAVMPAEEVSDDSFSFDDDSWRAHYGDGDSEPPRSSPNSDSSPWKSRVISCKTEWFTKAPAKRRWLLSDNRKNNAGVLPLGKAGLLIGEGGVSKTMALVALAIATSTGTSWLGCFDVETQGRVLMLLGEEDPEEVHRRCYYVAQATRTNAPPPDSIVVLPLAGVPCTMIETDGQGNVGDAAFLCWLRSYLAEHGPFALILVDPLSRFAGVNAEIDNAAATRFVQSLESLITSTEATLIVAHHTNKMARANGAAVTGASARGSSAIYDGVRWAAALSSERIEMNDDAPRADLAELVTLSIVKSNYSRKSDPVLLRRDPEHGGALLPLSSLEHEIISTARHGAEPSTRRRVERETEREAKAARLEEESQARDFAARTAKLTRIANEDAALCEILATKGGIGSRELRAEMAARLGGCSTDATDAALARLGARLRRDPGPRGTKFHSLFIGPIQELHQVTI